MALGGFRRMLLVVAGHVVDHRPPGHQDVQGPGWVDVLIPESIPAALNTLISARALTHGDGLHVDSAALAAHRAAIEAHLKEPSDADVLLRALAEKVGISPAEIASARAALTSARSRG
jgi:hypothetical protein